MSGAGKSGANWEPTTTPAVRTGSQRAVVEAQLDAAAADSELDAGDSPKSKPTNKPMTKPIVMTSTQPAPAGCSTQPVSQKEICNTIDDDCDKKVDEDCECPSAEPVACYDGPSGTLDLGMCRAGTRSCAAGELGPCVDAVLPGDETCNGIDDDCNGVVDDAPGLDADLQNCGRCGNVCARGESCCAGRCVNPRGEDREHCGACGMACTEGARPGCCGGRCIDLLTDTTCGSCNNACGLFKLGGGFLCTCMLLENGPQCAARNDNDQMLCQ